MTVPLVPVTIFFGLAGFFVGLRLYTRAFLTRAIGGEDILNFLAFVVSGVWWVAHVVGQLKRTINMDECT